MTADSGVNGNSAAGITGAAAARNDGQSEFNTALDQTRHFVFGVGRQHHERILNPPVSGIRHVRHTREAIEFDIVERGVATKDFIRAATQTGCLLELRCKVFDRFTRRSQQRFDIGATNGRLRISFIFEVGGMPSLVDFTQTVIQGINQCAATLRIVEHVVLQIRIPLHDPNIAQYFVKHTG